MISLRTPAQLNQAEQSDLADLLVAAVADGASVGFLPPLDQEEALAHWAGALEPGVILLLAEEDGRIVGTVQLQGAMRPNGSHRAEVAKLLVHPDARRRGIGRALMVRLEEEARAAGRTLLVLDTRAGDPANDLYVGLGFTEAGRIPRYARSAAGTLDDTVFYWKELG